MYKRIKSPNLLCPSHSGAIAFYKKISKPFSGITNIWFNANVIVYRDGAWLTEFGPGVVTLVPDWSFRRYDSAWLNLTIGAGGRVHITSINRRLDDQPASVGKTSFDFYLSAPRMPRVRWVHVSADGAQTELASRFVVIGTTANRSTVGGGFTDGENAAKRIAGEGGRVDGWWANAQLSGAKSESQVANGDVTFYCTTYSQVHLMLVDENGDTHELLVGEERHGSTITTSDPRFGTADGEVAKRYDEKVAGLTDRWYLGSKMIGDFKGGAFTKKKVDGPIYLWARITKIQFLFYVDGYDDDHLVYIEPSIILGMSYTLPAEALDKAIEPKCNKDADFGTELGSGFIGWFLDAALTEPAPETIETTASVTKLYGRNRGTVRCAYAEGSARPDPGADYRVAPEDDAEAYPRAMQLPDFSDEPAHKVTGPDGKTIELPAGDDNGEAHMLLYYDEVGTLPGARTVYERLGEGRWRTYRCEGWTAEDPDGAAKAKKGRRLAAPSARAGAATGAKKVQMRKDARYLVRWTESVVDGVVTTYDAGRPAKKRR